MWEGNSITKAGKSWGSPAFRESQAQPTASQEGCRGISVPASLSIHPLISAVASHWLNPTESRRTKEPVIQPRQCSEHRFRQGRVDTGSR